MQITLQPRPDFAFCAGTALITQTTPPPRSLCFIRMRKLYYSSHAPSPPNSARSSSRQTADFALCAGAERSLCRPRPVFKFIAPSLVTQTTPPSAPRTRRQTTPTSGPGPEAAPSLLLEVGAGKGEKKQRKKRELGKKSGKERKTGGGRHRERPGKGELRPRRRSRRCRRCKGRNPPRGAPEGEKTPKNGD